MLQMMYDMSYVAVQLYLPDLLTTGPLSSFYLQTSGTSHIKLTCQLILKTKVQLIKYFQNYSKKENIFVQKC